MPAAFSRTRSEMEKHIGEGGSVTLPDGRIVSRVEDLPAEADLAAGDHARLEAEKARLQGVMDAAKKDMEGVDQKLAALPKTAPAPAKTPATGDAGADRGAGPPADAGDGGHKGHAKK